MNPFQLNKFERQTLRNNLPRLLATDELRQRAIAAPLDFERVHQLVLDQTGDEAKAEKLAGEFILESSRRGTNQV